MSEKKFDVEKELDGFEKMRKEKVDAFRARIDELDDKKKEMTKAIDEEISALEKAVAKLTGVTARQRTGGGESGRTIERRSPEEMEEFRKDLASDGVKLMQEIKANKGEGFLLSKDLKKLTKTGLVKKALEPFLKEKKIVKKGGGAGTSFALA